MHASSLLNGKLERKKLPTKNIATQETIILSAKEVKNTININKTKYEYFSSITSFTILLFIALNKTVKKMIRL